MNSKELNDYILQFYKSNDNEGALLLESSWGTGKSYYITNTLIPELEKNGIRAIVISLYGIKSIFDLNKELFLQSRISSINKKRNKKNLTREIILTGGECIAKGLLSYFNINFDISERRLKKLYESINLNNCLIIFEDLERSTIDIIEVLGYIYQLVLDKTKILIVANEEEIISKHSNNYIKIKEKTISDTIAFSPIATGAVSSILKENEQLMLQNIDLEKLASSITNEIMLNKDIKCFNLRLLKYALAKFNDLFLELGDLIDLEFKNNVLLGTITYVLKNNNSHVEWKGSEALSSDLASPKYPLYKFMYDYIDYQAKDKDSILNSAKEYKANKEILRKNKELNDMISILRNYYVYSEAEVLKSLDKLQTYIEKNDDVLPLTEYGNVSNYLFSIVEELYSSDNAMTEKIYSILAKIYYSIKPTDKNKITEINITSGLTIFNPEIRDKQSKFLKAINSRLNEGQVNVEDYTVMNLSNLSYLFARNKSDFECLRFWENLNAERFCEFIVTLSASDIEMVREFFNSFKRNNTDTNFYNLISNKKKELYGCLIKLSYNDEIKSKMDKIQRLQISYLMKNLKEDD